MPHYWLRNPSQQIFDLIFQFRKLHIFEEDETSQHLATTSNPLKRSYDNFAATPPTESHFDPEFQVVHNLGDATYHMPTSAVDLYWGGYIRLWEVGTALVDTVRGVGRSIYARTRKSKESISGKTMNVLKRMGLFSVRSRRPEKRSKYLVAVRGGTDAKRRRIEIERYTWPDGTVTPPGRWPDEGDPMDIDEYPPVRPVEMEGVEMEHAVQNNDSDQMEEFEFEDFIIAPNPTTEHTNLASQLQSVTDTTNPISRPQSQSSNNWNHGGEIDNMTPTGSLNTNYWKTQQNPLRFATSDRRNQQRQEQSDSDQASRQLHKENKQGQERQAAEEKVVAERKAKEELVRAAEAKKEAERRGNRKAPPPGVILIPELDDEWNEEVDSAMDSQPSRELARTKVNVLTRKDFGTLLPQAGSGDAAHGWLNDDIILASLQHCIDYALERAHHREGKIPVYHTFNSFFYGKLAKNQDVSRWTKKAKIDGTNLLKVECVFIPVHDKSHWTLLVVWPKKRLVEYFDSYGGNHTPYTHNVLTWLQKELENKFIMSEWTALSRPNPQQYNAVDCGVFVLTTAKMVMLGWDPEKAYTQSDMVQQRRNIAAELLHGGFTDYFEPPDATQMSDDASQM